MTTTAARVALAATLTAAVPLTAVYDTPPMKLAGPSVVIAPDGWQLQNLNQVRYTVSVSCVLNQPDTTQALNDLEAMASSVWQATLAAGWAVDDMGGPDAVTYNDQPHLSMTFRASRLVTLTT